MGERQEDYLGLEIIDKLPTPEETFKVPKITWRHKITKLWGSAVIALGVSIGSGEFLLGPAMAIKYGLGLSWLIIINAALQTIFIYSWAKLVMSTGETPITLAFRIGWLASLLLTLGCFLTFIWGGWAASSAAALAGGILGRMPGPGDRMLVASIGTFFIILTIIILTLGQRIARTLEIFNWFDLAIILPSFIVLAAFLSGSVAWSETAKGLVSIGYVPKGLDLALLGGWVGFTGFASAINYILANYYKDKGFGMGSVTGYISGIVGGRKILVSPIGKGFKLTSENLNTFKRWCRLAAEELWIIFFIGAIIGMVIPMTLAYGLAHGWKISVAWGVPLWLALGLNNIYGAAGYWWGIIVAVLVLFKTQLGVADATVRALIDFIWKSERVRKVTKQDIRIVYYLILVIFLAWASVAMFTTAPVTLIIIAANMPNIMAIFAIPFLLYLNYKLPKELRLHPVWVVLNIVFMVMCLIFASAAIGKTLGLLR